MCANIRTKNDLASICEMENLKTGAFIRKTFTYIVDHNRAWFGQTTNIRMYDLTVHELNQLLQRVPGERTCPLKTTTIGLGLLGGGLGYLFSAHWYICLASSNVSLPSLA
jgi:hypothetical protein